MTDALRAKKWLEKRGFCITESQFEPQLRIEFIERRPGMTVIHAETIERDNLLVYARSKGMPRSEAEHDPD